MSEWAEATLGDVASINPESTPQNWPTDQAIRYIDIASVSWTRGIDSTLVASTSFGEAPGRARRIVREGDVLVSTVRPNLRAFAQVPADFDGEVASTGFAVVRAKEGRVAEGFAWALISSDRFVSDMVSKTTGSNYPAVRAEDVKGYKFTLPPVPVQERIVEVMSAVDDQVTALDSEADALEGVYRAATSLLWCSAGEDGAGSRFLGDVMQLDVVRTPMEAGKTYHLAGVLNAGKGLMDKGEFDGADTEYTAMNVLRENQVVMRKLTAWEGPITVVPAEFDGFVASSEFPTFTLAGDIAPGWMKHVCRTPRLWVEMQSRVVGTVQRRKRLNPDQLLSAALPVPSRPEQEQAAEALDVIEGQIAVIRTEAARLREIRAGLLSGLLDRTIDIESAELEF
jgi:type I restriction enzyme S subunit